MTTTTFGQFLELSIPAHDIQESLNFYHALGFSELPVGDIRNYHYGVVSDGRIAIGLHAGGIEEPALSFVKSDVAESLEQITSDGGELFFSRLGIEEFHEIGVHTPHGHLLIILEARTFSRAHLADLPLPILGHCGEISLGCRNPGHAAYYWSNAGFLANDLKESPTMEQKTVDTIELLMPGLRLGLRTDLPCGHTALRFTPDNLEQVLEMLDRRNVPVHRMAEDYRVIAPEGTHLNLVKKMD
jgi:hypothetical protein